MATTRKLIKGKGRRKEDDNNGVETADEDDVIDTSLNDEADVRLDSFLPSEKSEIEMNNINSKLAIMSICNDNGVSLYQHLSEMLARVLKPSDAGKATDEVEGISSSLKRRRVKSELTVTRDYPPADDVVSRQWRLFKKIGREIPDINPVYGVYDVHLGKRKSKSETDDDSDERDKHGGDSLSSKPGERKPTDESTETRLKVLPDLMRQCHMFNMAGAGLPATEYTRIALAMRELASAFTFKSMRFWGKILGIRNNYFIVETQLYEEDYENVDDEEDGDDDDGDNDTIDDIPPSPTSSFLSDSGYPEMLYKAPPIIPRELSGQGVNSFIYYVCNEPGLPWTRLPDVTPQQVTTARQISSLFTGDLDSVHATYPPFPGNEANYLRAQVARITSGACISPIGYFMFDEDDEEEEHAESRDSCVRNDDFEGVAMRDLSDSSLQYWVHHVNYILPQGRTLWFNPLNAIKDEGEDEEDEEEARREPDEPEPEFPQPLLIPISEDVDVGESPPWVTRLTSPFVPEHSPVSVTSVRWPGAVTVATSRGAFYENLYVGWGHKALASNFDPTLPPEAELEFPTGSEIMEQEDPTPEEEAAIKAAMREHEMMEEDNGEEEDEEEVEGEDEDLEDD